MQIIINIDLHPILGALVLDSLSDSVIEGGFIPAFAWFCVQDLIRGVGYTRIVAGSFFGKVLPDLIHILEETLVKEIDVRVLQEVLDFFSCLVLVDLEKLKVFFDFFWVTHIIFGYQFIDLDYV